jgi:signal transduction histidine kinase
MENKCKILLLDENPDSSQRTKEILKSIGINHLQTDIKTIVENSTSTQHDCNICLLDYSSGKKNGLIHSKNPLSNLLDLPVILLADKKDIANNNEIESLDLDYLIKSDLNPWMLSRAIKCNLTRHYANNELFKKNQEINNLIRNMDSIIDKKTKSLETTRDNLKKSLEKEIKLSEMKSKFVSMASHEFRTPLSSILSSASLIEKYSDNIQEEKRKRHISKIKTSVQNLSFILNDFLSLDKIESGNIHHEPLAIDFEEFAGQIIDELSSLMHKNQFIRFHHEGNNIVKLDPNLMKNVLINLLSNAIKYSPEGQDIFLESEFFNNLLRIKVRDNGIGIPETDKNKMFEFFFRASNAYHIQGTGLGLTIVKRYLDLMGGNIDYKSVVGKGTTFEITLPIADTSGLNS